MKEGRKEGRNRVLYKQSIFQKLKVMDFFRHTKA